MIYYHPYQLHTTQPLNSKESALCVSGVLLRYEDGVGCLQPWPSLGDAPLEHHLAQLAAGDISPLAQRALDCCRWDGAARRAHLSLFSGKSIPRSHATLTQFPTPDACSALVAAGFTHLKIKANGVDAMLVEKLTALQPTGLRIRLDFNHSLSPAALLALARQLPSEAKSQLDFIEDPFPYEANLWHTIEQATSIPLALDRHSSEERGHTEVERGCARANREPHPPTSGTNPLANIDHPTSSAITPHHLQISIWKPATEALPHPALRTVITSNMDHAIGQMYAAAMAAHHGTTEICGLLTHELFRADDFFSQVQSSGPTLQAPSGTGLGFDDLITSLPWKRLS